MSDKTTSTYNSESETKPLTLEELKKAASKIKVGAPDTGKRKGWFERMMNRRGWYRSSEWYILRESQFNQYPFLDRRPKL